MPEQAGSSMPEQPILQAVVIDCAHPEVLAEFWCSLLGVRLDARNPRWFDTEPVAPGAPKLAFQRVPEGKPGRKNRLHLDVLVADLDTATPQAEALGATRVGDVVPEEGGAFQVMRDPERNEFCLVVVDDSSRS
jgi:hypothetical protein